MRSNTIHYKIQWGDTDAAGIVFYPDYFRWFDLATHEFFGNLCWTVPRVLDGSAEALTANNPRSRLRIYYLNIPPLDR